MPEEVVNIAQPLPKSFTPPTMGRSMQAISQKVAAERERLRVSGLVKPCSVVNFNPIPLRVETEAIRTECPAAGKGLSFKLRFRGREYPGSWITFREAIVRPKIRNVSKPDGADDPIAEYDTCYALPIEQGWLFWNEYNGGDSPIGGVLVYEGDVHVLAKKPTDLLLPTFTTLSDRTRNYFAQPRVFEDVVEEIFATQRRYCDWRLDRAQSLFNDPDQRKNLDNVDRLWANFALTNGWIQQQPEWIFAKTDQADVCLGCGAVKKHPKAQYCVCGKWYDPYSSYMSGESVPPAYLVNLPADQLEKVKKEAERRKKIAADLAI